MADSTSARSPTASPKSKILDLLLGLALGVFALFAFHLDHLVASYSGWNDPLWWLHLLVDGSYVVIYGGLAFVALRGWRIWRSRTNAK
ncbi:MAG TPA: hypothetical protein VER55_15545 [Ardenticatenaceae bacterium]|nr:hypothetical protein [Ardenticatenaceae bacterium]